MMFGEYLVKKNLISDNQLLDVLLEQISRMPSLPAIVHKYSLLTAGDILKALTYQSEHGVDFKSACNSLNLWKSEFDDKINLHVDTDRIPIGQLLHEKGLVSFSDLIKALDGYQAEQSKEVTPPLLSNTVVAELPKAAEPVVAANRIVPNPEAISSELLDQYDMLFSEQSYNAIIELTCKLKDTAPSAAQIKQELLTVVEQLHGIKGSAQYVGLLGCAQLLDAVEDLTRLSCKVDGVSSEQYIQVVSIIGQAAEALWNIKTLIHFDGNESQTWTMFKENINALEDQIAQINVDLQKYSASKGSLNAA